MSSPQSKSSSAALVLPGLLSTCETALAAADAYLAMARGAVAQLAAPGGKVDGKKLDEHQFAAHALSWTATYVEAMRRLLDWARRLNTRREFGEIEQLILQSAFGEYLAQLQGGLAL